MFYKMIEDNILTMVGKVKTLPPSVIEITEEEYNNILSIIQSKPEDSDTVVYKLNAETLEYEPYDRPEEPVEEETDPVVESILSEVASNGY